ncbi:MAG: caspase family protein [Pirellulaceae bacterium]
MNETTTSQPGAVRAWRGVQRTSVVGKSRLAWRWILSLTAVGLMIAAAIFAWPSPAPRTLLLTLSDDREDRNTIPPVPFVEADLEALRKWAQAANVPVCERSLADIPAPQSFVRSLLSGRDGQRSGIEFQRNDKRPVSLQPGDTLVIYVKGHGIALDLGTDEQPRVVPLLVTSLTEEDLGGNWGKSGGTSRDCKLNVAELLKELATLEGIPKVVILDAMHLGYDPRLGTLANAFPEAVAQSIPPDAKDLWVVLAAGDGEVAVDDPHNPGTSFVTNLTSALQREAHEKSPSIDLSQLVAEAAAAMDARQSGGLDSFYQRPRLLSPVANRQARVEVPRLPQSVAAKEPTDEKTGEKDAKQKPAAAKSAYRRGAIPVLALQQITTSDPPAKPPATAPQPAQPATAAQPAAAIPKPGATAAPRPKAPVDDLDRAWQLRDRLLRRTAQPPSDFLASGWSPVHFAPHRWRRLEGILVGFDERAVSSRAGDGPVEDVTLSELCKDLEALELWLDGGSKQPQLSDCATISQAFRLFQGADSTGSIAWQSLQAHEARRRQDLGEPTATSSPHFSANAALKTFAEATYDAHNLVQLQGRMACVPDGGPEVGDALDRLFESLHEYRRLLATDTLMDGRLDRARLRQLGELANRLKQLEAEIDGKITAYARAVAAGRSPGRLLRIRLLLGSPLLAADDRLALRLAATAASPAKATDAAGVGVALDWQALNGRLEKNIRWTLDLLRIATPSNPEPGSPKRATAALATAITAKLSDSGAAPNDRFAWTRLGRHFLDFGEALPAQIAAEHRRFHQDGELSPAELLDIYLLSTMLDGRDARRLSAGNLPVWIAQPLRPERLPDRIELTADRTEIQLSADDRKEGSPLELTVQVQSEHLPPYDISLELNWPRAADIRLQWEDGKPVRSVETIRLQGNREQLKLRILPPTEDRAADSISIGARAEFADSAKFANVEAAEVQIACLLPRPDRIKLLVVAEHHASAGNLADAQELQRGGEQGGRLWLFPNRAGGFQFYLTATDDRKLHARLYRVPSQRLDETQRLFDPKAPGRLLKKPAELDAEIRKALDQQSLDRIPDLKGHLLAQTDEKTPLTLGPGVTPVLAALQPPPPPAMPTAAATSPPASVDVTAGLVLVLFSDNQPREPYVKWLEVQPYVPDDLLEVKNPAFNNGRLSFQVGLKDPRIAAGIGLAETPLIIRWDETSRSSAPSDERIGQGTFEAPIGSPEDNAQLEAMIPNQARWPIEVQLQIGGYPRALLVELERAADGQVTAKNLKPNRPPAIHLGQLRVEKRLYRILPHRPRLPFPPSLQAPDTEDKDLQIFLQNRVPAGEIAIPVGPRQIRGAFAVDLQAEVSREDFAGGARIELKVNGQSREPFLFDRRVAVKLIDLQAGSIKLANQVTDFTGLPVETSLEGMDDRRVEVVASVAGGQSDRGGAGAHQLTVIFDRNAPTLSIEEALPREVKKLPASLVKLQAFADDGPVGSGIESLSFFVGLDANNNRKLDESERSPEIPGKIVSSSGGAQFRAAYSVPDESPNGVYLIEATATDKAGHVSLAKITSFKVAVVAKAVPGKERPSFGSDKKKEPAGSVPE